MTLDITTLQEVDETGANVGAGIDFESNTLSPIVLNLELDDGPYLTGRAGPLQAPFGQGGGGGSVRPTTGMIYPRGQG